MGAAQRIGVYPGTFDPITLGHADIIRRGAKLVDQLIIGVTTNQSKNPMFTPEERIAMVEREVATLGIGNVSVIGFNALLMHFAEKQKASVVNNRVIIIINLSTRSVVLVARHSPRATASSLPMGAMAP